MTSLLIIHPSPSTTTASVSIIPVIARFLSGDPLMKDYPMLTPYQFASNRPIEGFDLEGLEFVPNYARIAEGLKSQKIIDHRTIIHKSLYELSRNVPNPNNPTAWSDIEVWKNFSLPGINPNKKLLSDAKISFISSYKSIINEATTEFNIPPVLLAGVAYREFGGDPPSIDDMAYAARIFPIGSMNKALKTSFGDLSMQIKIAGETLGYNQNEVLDNSNAIISDLKDTRFQFFLTAKHLSDLRDIDFCGKNACELSDEEISIIGTRYNRGSAPNKESIDNNSHYGDDIIRNKKILNEALENN